jgi:hypothetical protein
VLMDVADDLEFIICDYNSAKLQIFSIACHYVPSGKFS